MDILQAIVLAVLQGLTEWLPVSSSGHLAIAQQLMGTGPQVLFDIFLHFGTLITAAVFFWKDLMEILKSVLRLDFKSDHGRLFVLMAIASVPTAIIGFAFKGFFESMFSSMAMIGAALVITGAALLLSERMKAKAGGRIGAVQSFIVGIAQGIAVAPGISRSGATISTGLALGLDRETAARFSFLILIPAVLGATAFELKDAMETQQAFDPLLLAAGVATSAMVGYIAMGAFLGFVKKERLDIFAYYCLIIGAAAIAASMAGLL
ncbi:Undecaprenyl-diphosphatase [uncultured archaeon]|nr:Undecaprenyl-diphosphatase [uncultured archaeon]